MREWEAEREKLDTEEEERIKESQDKHEQRELKDGEWRIQEHDDDTTCAPSPTAKAAINPAPHEHVWFDWATNINTSIGPVPSLRDFRSSTPTNHTHEPIANQITSDTAPRANESYSPASLIKPSVNGCPNRSSKSLSPLGEPHTHTPPTCQPTHTPTTCSCTAQARHHPIKQ